MIDTHCHLTDPRLGGQLDAVLARAAAAGVTRMVTIGCTPDDARAAIGLCRSRPQIRCAVGIHPNYSHDFTPADLQAIEELQHASAVVALGEMGLDYHHKFAPVAHQRVIFTQQLAMAQRLGRPVIIHCREAVDDTLAILRDFPTVPAVFHCFTGSYDEAMRLSESGYLIGFTGPLTFKRNDELRRAAADLPADQIVVETDAPYLSPEPVRAQKVNEPALVMHTAAALARVRGVSIEEIDALTTANACRFYRWP